MQMTIGQKRIQIKNLATTQDAYKGSFFTRKPFLQAIIKQILKLQNTHARNMEVL
jgi:hypothetical protein